MKNIFLLSFLAIVLFSQCTPKTGDITKKPEDLKEVMEEVEKEIGVTDFRSSAPTPGPAPKIQLGTYEQFEMENGLKVIVVENHKLPRVTFSLSLEVDPISEKEFSGAADMAGQLMAHGTTTRTKAQIDEEIDFMGASLSSSATGMFAGSLTKHSDNLLKIMSDVLLNPSFPVDEFEKVKKQTISGLASSKDDPNAIAGNVAQVLRYGKDHPYGEVVTEETVGNITNEKVKEHYNNYFRPNVAYLIVVGDITPTDAKTMVNKYFGSWKRASVPKSEFPMPMAPKETTIDFVNKTGAVQSVINVTYPVDFKPGSSDAIKASVMNTLLGGFFRSRLNGNLREDKGYTYGIRSSLRSDKEVGSFTTSAGVRNEVTDSSIVQIMYELNRLKTEPVPAKELALVKNYLSGSFARSLENPQTVARFALNTIKYNLPKDYYENYLENLSRVSAADVMMMANKYIKPDNAHIVVVGNKGEVAEKLSKISKVNYYNNYGEEVKETFEIPAGTTAETVIADYVNAIGGEGKLAMIKDISITMSASMMGANLTSVLSVTGDGKFSNVASMAGMGVMSKEVYNNGKGFVQQQGQTLPVDAAKLASLKERAVLFPEMKYDQLGYKLKLVGAENLDGVNAYAVEIETPSGEKTTNYFSVETSLKIREVMTEQGQTITTNFSEYKEVDGIMFPHKTSLVGVTPVPLDLITESVKVNKGIDPAVFKID